MKKVIKFSKFFVPATILSVSLIVFGVVGFFVKGINFGIDFKPGLIEDVAVVPTAIELTYVRKKTNGILKINKVIDWR